MQEILEKHQVRKTNAQKSAFIDYLKNRLYKSGYTDNDIKIEEKGKGVFKTRNIVVGNPEEADVINQVPRICKDCREAVLLVRQWMKAMHIQRASDS